MIDFAHLEQYRENNRIEAKKARGGLPLLFGKVLTRSALRFRCLSG